VLFVRTSLLTESGSSPQRSSAAHQATDSVVRIGPDVTVAAVIATAGLIVSTDLGAVVLIAFVEWFTGG
jgi:hypothetical protein